MQRGELYLVPKQSHLDPKRQRVYVIVSRQDLIRSSFPTVICAPVFTKRLGLATQVAVGVNEGLKHDSSIHCDELMSLPKSVLSRFVGSLSSQKLRELDLALAAALDLVK